jgi:hypothetical protein
MVYKITHEELSILVKELHKKQTSLMCYGTFGIGKSFVVRDSAIELAKKHNKTFIEWAKITKEEKMEVFKNPSSYFVLVDVRLSEYGSEDLKGIPKLDSNDFLDWKISLWELLIQKKDSMGILFLDEFNLASPMVLSASYKILNDRTIGEGKICDDWAIIGAGNLASDRAFTFDLPLPLRDRCCECELQNSDIENFTEYMVKKGFMKEIIAFINAHSSVMRNVAQGDSKVKNTTTRGWERLNNLIKDKINIDKEFEILCSTAIGEGIASDFIAYCKIQKKLNIEDFIKNPQKILEIKGNEALSLKYFLITCVADQYKDNKLNFKKVIEICKVFDKEDKPEYVTLLWSLCISYAKEKFRKEVTFSEGEEEELIAKYSKYLLNEV